MLQIAGFKAFPVIINNGPKKDKAVPQPYFNHAISCVESSDGTYILMDSTDESTRRICPAYLCDKSYVVAKPNGETLLTSSIIPADENLMKISTTGTLLNNELTAKTIFSFEGINDNAYRGYFSRLKEKERRKFFETHIKRLFPGASLKAISISPKNLMNTSKPLRVTTNYTVSDYTMNASKYTLIPPVWFGTSFGMVNFILGKTGLQKRKYPLQTKIACGVDETFKITVDNNFTLASTPEFTSINNEQIFWKQNLEFKKKILKGKSKFLIKAVEFSSKEYISLKQALKDIEYNKRKQQIFNSSSKIKCIDSSESSADARLISQELNINIKDSNNWETTEKVKEEVLTYNGKKDISELVFNYNPIWETVEITKAQVTTKGVTKVIGKQELNTMDASWVGSAPRYSAAKTLVANLPSVEIGSIIEYTVKRTYKNQPFFSMREHFKTDMPIDKKIVTLTKPINLNLDITYQHGENIFTREQSLNNKYIKFTWDCENQPQIEPVPYLAPTWSTQPTLLLSTGHWEKYTSNLIELINQRITNQPKTSAKAKNLTKQLKTNIEKILAIRNFVSKSIRTDGPSFTDLPLSSLSNADDTLFAGYGHEADKAILLKSMLNAISIKSNILLASNMDNISNIYDPVINTPQRDLFRTLLIEAQTEKGNIILNDTNQYAELGVSPHENEIAINLENAKKQIIEVSKDKETRVQVEYIIDIDKKGNAQLKKTKQMWGEKNTIFKKTFSEMNTEKKKMYDQELASSISQAAIQKSKVISQYKTYPSNEVMELYIPRYAVVNNEFGYLKLPVSFINKIIPQFSDTRKSSYYRSNKTDISVEVIVNLPENITEIEHIPETFEWVSPNNTGEISVLSTKTNNRIKINYSIKLKPAIFTPDEIKEIRDVSKQLIKKSMKLILYRS